MFDKILFPTDFSSYAYRIADCIRGIPGVKELIILHVIDTKKATYEDEKILVKEAELKLQETERRLSSIESVKTKVVTGIPSREIIRQAGEENASLIVMGARGRSLIKDILLGSVSSDVLRYGKTNLMICRFKSVEGKMEQFCERPFSRVLIPVDFSDYSKKVVDLICKMPVDKAILLHVVDKAESEEELDANIKEAKMKLEKLLKFLQDKGIDASYHVHVGEPANEINKAAEEEDVSLIAIGTKGKGLIEEIMVGSTAESTIRNAKRPVLVIKKI